MNDQIIQMISDGKFAEAHALAKENYKQTQNKKMLYLWTTLDLDFVHEMEPLEAYNNLKSVRNIITGDQRIQYSYFLSLAAYFVEKYEEAYENAYIVIVANIPIINAYIICGHSAFLLNHPQDEVFKYLDKAVELSDDDHDSMLRALNIKMECLLTNNKLEEAKKLLNEIYIKTNDRVFSKYCELRIARHEYDVEAMDRLLADIIDESDIDANELLYSCAEEALDHDDAEVAMRYNQQNYDRMPGNVEYLDLQKARIYMCKNDCVQAKEIFEKLVNSKTPFIRGHAKIFLSRTLASSDDMENILEGARLSEEIGNELTDYSFYIAACKAYSNAKKVSPARLIMKLEVVLSHLYKTKSLTKEDGSEIFEVLQHYYLHLGEYNKALKIWVKYRKFLRFDPMQLFEILDNPTKVFPFLLDSIRKTDWWGKRTLANVLFHGLYGSQVDKTRAYILAKDAYEEASDVTCAISMYGTTLIERNPKAAFEVFEKGKKIRDESIRNCSCCVPFYAYCLYEGIGVEKDKAKAYKVLEKVVDEDGIFANENTTSLYGYLSWLEGKNLNKAIQVLLNCHEYKTQVAKYYCLAKLAQKAGNNNKKYVKMFKKNLAYASSEERKYYEGNPTFPYMTNF